MRASLDEQARSIITAGIEAVLPQRVMKRNISAEGDTLRVGGRVIDLAAAKRLVVLGAGKAAAAMAQTLEEILGDRIDTGCVVTKYGHSLPCRRITVREAGHPLVDANGLTATAEILELARGLGETDVAIVLISGGGSALLEQFPSSITLAEARRTMEALLRSGTDIAAMNAVRKHLSLVKGGQLARALAPCPSITMLISDVIGDRLDVIASGPTVADPTTFADAWGVLERFGLVNHIPATVAEFVRDGLRGLHPETPKPGDPEFAITRHHILASNTIALEAAAVRAGELGFRTQIVTSSLSGEARDCAAAVVREVRRLISDRSGPVCLLYGGEMTVTVRGDGLGGRCQEFALAALGEMAGVAGDYVIAGCGTDGTDGPTDAAGGMATRAIAKRAADLGLSPTEFLTRNDANRFLRAAGGLIVTGPTGTNVMDLCLALIPSPV